MYFIALTEDSLTLFNVSRTLVLPNGKMLSESNSAKANFKEWTWNYLRQLPGAQHRQPADFLALHCKEACIHADT
jgi:hypothetical protein